MRDSIGYQISFTHKRKTYYLTRDLNWSAFERRAHVFSHDDMGTVKAFIALDPWVDIPAKKAAIVCLEVLGNGEPAESAFTSFIP